MFPVTILFRFNLFDRRLHLTSDTRKDRWKIRWDIIYLIIIIADYAKRDYLYDGFGKNENNGIQTSSERINSRGSRARVLFASIHERGRCYLKNIYPLFENVRSFDSRAVCFRFEETFPA